MNKKKSIPYKNNIIYIVLTQVINFASNSTFGLNIPNIGFELFSSKNSFQALLSFALFFLLIPKT